MSDNAPLKKNPLRKLGMLLPPWRELLQQRSAIGLCLVSVILTRLCHPPLGLWPLAFVALVPWLYALRGTTVRNAFWLSWIFGFSYFIGVYLWLGSLSRFNPAIWLGIPLLCLFQGIYPALGGAGMVWLARRLPPTAAFVLSGLWWIGWEWFRSRGALGAAFALTGQMVRDAVPLLQVVSIGGMGLLSLLVFFVNLSLMEVAACASKRVFDIGAAVRATISIVLVLAGFVYGIRVIPEIQKTARQGIPVRIALIQTNVDQETKFRSYAARTWDEMRALQNDMTVDALRMIDALEPGTLDLVVFPESTFTQYQFDHDEVLQQELRDRANDLGATIIAGANDLVFVRPDGTFSEKYWEADKTETWYKTEMYGGFYVFRPDDEELKVRADYHKIHLMPFGETVPYFDKIPGLVEHIVQIGSFLRGDPEQAPVWVSIAGDAKERATENLQIHLGPSICFEDMFHYLHARMARQGATLFVNITNNAWFDPSDGSLFHFEYSIPRATEARIPMVFGTNTGVTAVVDAAGRIVEQLPRREQAILQTTVHVPREPQLTPASRFGNWVGRMAFFLSWLVLSGVIVHRRRAGSNVS